MLGCVEGGGCPLQNGLLVREETALALPRALGDVGFLRVTVQYPMLTKQCGSSPGVPCACT